MNFEALLPVILLILWAVLSSRLKKGQRDAGPEPVSPSSDTERPDSPARPRPERKSLFENLRESLETVMQEVAQQTHEQPRRMQQETEKHIQTAEEKRAARLASGERRRQEKGMNKNELEFLQNPSEPLASPPPVVIERTEVSMPAPSREELRKAIIWSEILAKPVALRH